MLLLFFEKSFILYVNMRVSELAFQHDRGGFVQNVQDRPLGFVHVYNSRKYAVNPALKCSGGCFDVQP